jgi:hypothetical protein
MRSVFFMGFVLTCVSYRTRGMVDGVDEAALFTRSNISTPRSTATKAIGRTSSAPFSLPGLLRKKGKCMFLDR